MLIQLIKELGLLLVWRELTLKPGEHESRGKRKRKLGFKAKHAPGFETLQLIATWALALFLLSVSVPHSIEVIHRYEKGSDEFRELKSVLLAITIEVIAALVLLIALHTTKLSHRQRRTLFGLATPFVLLTLHLQFVYYAGLEQWLVYPWELAVVLPGGVLVCAIVVAFLWPFTRSVATGATNNSNQPGQMVQPLPNAPGSILASPLAVREDLQELKGQIAALQQSMREMTAAVRIVQDGTAFGRAEEQVSFAAEESAIPQFQRSTTSVVAQSAPQAVPQFAATAAQSRPQPFPVAPQILPQDPPLPHLGRVGGSPQILSEEQAQMAGFAAQSQLPLEQLPQIYANGLTPQNAVGGMQAQYSPVEPQSAFGTAVPSLPALRLVKPEQPQAQGEAHLAQKDSAIPPNAVALPQMNSPQAAEEPFLGQEEPATSTGVAQQDEEQGGTISNLLRWPSLTPVTASSVEAVEAEVADSSTWLEPEDHTAFTYPKGSAEAPSVQEKEEEALRLYHELGTYARVAEQMGFKSDRTASNLVRRALARRNATEQLNWDIDSRGQGSAQRK